MLLQMTDFVKSITIKPTANGEIMVTFGNTVSILSPNEAEKLANGLQSAVKFIKSHTIELEASK